jgi:hypothetical protein
MRRAAAGPGDERFLAGGPAAIPHRAIERGELPADTDIEFGLDFLAGPLYRRAGILRNTPDAGRLQRLTDKIIAALTT